MASVYVVTAAETIVDLMDENGFSTLTNSKVNDVRLFGVGQLDWQQYQKIYIQLGVMKISFLYMSFSFRDQAYDVPVGMFSAIAVCILYNLICIFIPAATMLRDVSGDIIPEFNNATFSWKPFPCAMNHTCDYGLINFFQVC
uniref:Amino acid permease/ SLC12A domain-containing protein n=1 Tax=Wuchereria bancrofti TaxID=6293 RepID=A0A1I8EPH7_WUCBA